MAAPPEAFDEIVREHQAALFRYARTLTRDAAAAEDVLQETFLSAYRAWDAFRGESAVRTWLFTIARRFAIRRGRRRSGEPSQLEELPELGHAAGWGDPDTPESLALASERRRSLERAFGELPRSDREVLALRDLEGLTTEQAAEVLGISAAALSSRIHRARLHLMARLRGKEASHGQRA